MEANRISEHRLRFTTEELHLFQEAILLVHPTLEPLALYDERQWNVLCSAALVFVNTVKDESNGQRRLSHTSPGYSSESDFGGVSTEATADAATSWKLYAKPPSISIDRGMLLSSKVGDIIEHKGMMGCSLLFLVIVTICLEYFAPVSDVKYARKLSNGNRIFHLRRCSTSMLVLHLASRIVFAILLAHRINRQILLTSVFYFETVVSTGALVLAHGVWIANCLFLAQDMYTVQALVEDGMLLVCNFPIFIFMSASDSLRFGLLPKIMSVAIICSQLAATWLRTRCINDDWGDPFNCEPMDTRGLSPRELFLMACTQSLVFLMQCIVKQVGGNEFAVLRPCYRFSTSRRIRSSSRHDSAMMDYCWASVETTEMETFVTSMHAIGYEGERITQSLEMHGVVHQMKPLLVQVLNSAWNESIPLGARISKDDVSEISSGRSSRNSAFGASHLKWHLRSDPAKLELSRATILSSRLGMKLHERGLMGKLVAFLGVLVISGIRLLPSKEVRQGDMIYPGRGWVALAALWITVCLLLVALQHNMNRDLFAILFGRFETWVLTLASVVKAGTFVYRITTTFPEANIVLDVIVNQGILNPLFAIHVNCIDCWRFSRRARIILYCLVLVYYIFEYFVARCVRNYWGEPANCSIEWRAVDGLRLREIYLGLLVSCLLFFVKALHRHLFGQVFAVWHPQYCLQAGASTPSAGISALGTSTSPNIGTQEAEEEEKILSDSAGALHDSLNPTIGRHGNENKSVDSSEPHECMFQNIIEQGSSCVSFQLGQTRGLPERFSL